jgi:hypothetical protein
VLHYVETHFRSPIFRSVNRYLERRTLNKILYELHMGDIMGNVIALSESITIMAITSCSKQISYVCVSHDVVLLSAWINSDGI